MVDQFLDVERLQRFPRESFTGARPFPWYSFEQLIRRERFEELCREFPPLELFEFHQDLPRTAGQRPHNRYYLAYEESIYTRLDHSQSGIARDAQLPKAWRDFIHELEQSPEYRRFIQRLFGADGLEIRYAWHVGVTNSEVSPHRDAGRKLGTHIFYFNTSEDWDSAWGGSTLVLHGKRVAADNPDFSDFEQVEATPFLDNRSFLFQNTQDAWHGVQALTCPEDRYRRLFNVIFEAPRPQSRSLGGLLARTVRGLASLARPRG
ncbi:MAG TPA: 2OG-Fe(II) oxygenase [Gemmatimonadales bacterium]|nr:2OG-Fe(II) oxygenase [Gemmatimonadales bacterium]